MVLVQALACEAEEQVAMTQLTADVNARDSLWLIDAPLSAEVTHLQAEDEVVTVDLHPPLALKIRVTRAAGGEAASHVSGTTLTPLVPQFASSPIDTGGGAGVSVTAGGIPVVPIATGIDFPLGTVSDLGAGVAGIGLIVAAVGPFRVQHGTSGLEAAAGALLMDLTPGTYILNTWANVFEDFNGGSTRLRMGGWRAGALDTVLTDAGSNVGDDRSSAMSSANTPSSPFLPSIVRVSGVSLRAQVDGSGLTTGDADIYAIIATPAS